MPPQNEEAKVLFQFVFFNDCFGKTRPIIRNHILAAISIYCLHVALQQSVQIAVNQSWIYTQFARIHFKNLAYTVFRKRCFKTVNDYVKAFLHFAVI